MIDLPPLVRPALLLLLVCLTTAFRAPDRPLLENLDQRKPGGSVAATKRLQSKSLPQVHPGWRVRFDAITQTAALVQARDGFLTGPAGAGDSLGAKALAAFPNNDPHRLTKAFLDRHSTLFGHGAQALSNAVVVREFVTAHNQLRTVVWEQRHERVSLFEAVLVAHVTAREELVSVASQFVSEQALTRGQAKAGRRSPAISARQAVESAARNLGAPLSGTYRVLESDPGPEQRQRLVVEGLAGETMVKQIWLPVGPDEIRLCWDVLLKPIGQAVLYRVLVDAGTGAVWVRRSLTNYLTNATYRVFPGESPTPMSPGHATPQTNQPPEVARSLITLTALMTNASPAGWLTESENETSGNNVAAHLDRNGDDDPDFPRPQGFPHHVFDFPFDTTQEPTSFGAASVVQLFYLNNWVHDRLYELGFTEAAGNFQRSNFGRGGQGNDAVLADAQDGSDVNNANFSTPPDGLAPRMQMFLFDDATPDRDGDFDAQVVVHEYAHGLSNRRVGGGIGISAPQTLGMGEGWSDFYALSLLSKPTDDPAGNYPLGAYASFDAYGLRHNYYFGIRRYPYSTDLTKNPLTFRDIDPTQADAHGQVPNNPAFGNGGAEEIHNQGEVWCVALWEARARLIDKYGWTNGNQLMLQLVTDGMNLSPSNPDFIEARDAILLADQVNHQGANRLELWAAFAKRGLGAAASSPSSATTIGIRESFDLPDDLEITPASGFISSGPVGGPFNVTNIDLGLFNRGSNVLNWKAMSTATWLTVSPLDGNMSPLDSNRLQVSLAPASTQLPTGIYSGTILLTNELSGVSQSRSVTLRVAQPDNFTELFRSGLDLAHASFTFLPDDSGSRYVACRQSAASLPTDPAGSTSLVMTDDSFEPITLSGTNQVSVYGHRTNAVFIGSNGFITWESGDLTFSESVFTHFSQPRVTGLFRDLNPAQGGTVSWKQTTDRLAVTWLNVTEYGRGNSNTFQIELFFNGTIRLTYLQLDATAGLAGLSPGGGIPAAFAFSDFSLYENCNEPPRLQATQIGDSLVLRWAAFPGRRYQVQASAEVDQGYLNLGPELLGTGTFTNRVEDTRRFYRVLVLP